MKILFSHLSKFNSLIILCIIGLTAFSGSAIANPMRDVQNEVAKRRISPEDVNRGMREKFPYDFPYSDFPYHEPVNGCSTPWYISVIPYIFISNVGFRRSCNAHDICYMTSGRTKFSCDNELFENISRICEIRGLSCSFSATAYYAGVDKHGQEPYDTAQKEQSRYIKSVYTWLSTLDPNAAVFRTNRYVNTDITVKPGDRLRIRASGAVKFGSLAGSGSPNGIIIDSSYNYFADVPHGRLMARFRQIGMGDFEGWSPIGVGSDQLREVELSAPGVLEFLVNDNEPGNNSGAFRIEVTIQSDKQ